MEVSQLYLLIKATLRDVGDAESLERIPLVYKLTNRPNSLPCHAVTGILLVAQPFLEVDVLREACSPYGCQWRTSFYALGVKVCVERECGLSKNTGIHFWQLTRSILVVQHHRTHESIYDKTISPHRRVSDAVVSCHRNKSSCWILLHLPSHLTRILLIAGESQGQVAQPADGHEQELGG